MRIIVHKSEDNWVEEQFPAFTDDHPPSNKGEPSPLSTRTNQQIKLHTTRKLTKKQTNTNNCVLEKKTTKT